MTQGDNTNAKGTESYLIPWNWDSETGDQVASEEEKLYHWNTQGGETTWELQDSGKNLTDVKVYKLTDLGKTEEQTIPVVDGTITLTAEGGDSVCGSKGDEANLEITWSEGMHIVGCGLQLRKRRVERVLGEIRGRHRGDRKEPVQQSDAEDGRRSFHDPGADRPQSRRGIRGICGCGQPKRGESIHDGQS